MTKRKSPTKRTPKKAQKQPSNWKRTIFTFSLKIALLVICLLGGFIGSIYLGLFGPLPSNIELLKIKNSEASEVYSADGVLLGKFYLQDRSAVPYGLISPHAIQALVSTEDARFFEHSGIDYRSLFRVLIRTVILQDRSGGGGSTITQQLAKNIYGRKTFKYLSTPINKIREIFIAKRLEEVYSKEDIITLYCNTVPFGDNVFGIESTSQRFFNKHAKDLTIPEAATIIGMLKANYSYNPRLFPEKSLQRRNVVISQMNKYNYLTRDDMESYHSAPLALDYKKQSHREGIATYFREQVRQKALKWCAASTKSGGTPYNLYTDGLKIHTTLHSKMQRHAEKALAIQMKAIQAVFKRHIDNKEPWRTNASIIDRAIRRSNRYRSLAAKGMKMADILKNFEEKVPMEIFTYAGEKQLMMSPIDSIKHYLSFLNAGFIAMNSHTGATQAWVGGIDYKYFQYDHVQKSTKRQVGSTFKPIVYAAAIEAGIEPCAYISAEKVVYENYDNWTPENGEDNYDQKYSMLGALTKSVNTVAVNLLDQVGIGKVINLANRMGIESDLPHVPSIALGVANISMVEMASAYSAFSNTGNPVSPYAIERIVDASGNTVYEHAAVKSSQVITKETSELMLAMMKSVVDKGTGSRIRWKYHLSNDLAGKTGTTQSNTDGWFAATLPDLVMISWVGADNPAFHFRSTALGQGANTALPITAHFLTNINQDASLHKISKATFPLPSSSIADQLDCQLKKEDKNFIEKIFGKNDKEVKKDFGDSLTAEKEKKGLFNKVKGLFKKKQKKD
jgi:penicillin-binding protein 1A